MTLRLLLIGNSHLAAFKLGWDKIAGQYPDVRCDFFGGAANWIEGAVFEHGAIKVTVASWAEIVAQVTGGRTSVAVRDYDAIVFIGLRFGLAPYMRQLSRLTLYDLGRTKAGFRIVSKSCLRQLVSDILADTPAFRWSSMIAEAGGRPVFLVPQPLSSESRLEHDPSVRRHPNFKAQAAAWLAGFQSAARTLTAAKGLTLVEQPASTVALPGFTRAELSRGSVRLLNSNAKHAELEFNHMNTAYGIELLHTLLPAVKTRVEAVSKGV
jgi:hypothetical protein